MGDLRGLSEFVTETGDVDGEALRSAWVRSGEEKGVYDLGYIGEPEAELDDAVSVAAWMRSCLVPPRYMRADPALICPCREYATFVQGAASNWQEGLGLMLFGVPDTGKSMAMAHALRCCWTREKPPTALWVTEADLVEAKRPDGRRDIYEKALRVDVLALDDFGVAKHSEFVLETLETLAETRHANMRCLLMTSNLKPSEIEHDQTLRRVWRRWSQDCVTAIMRTQNKPREA